MVYICLQLWDTHTPCVYLCKKSKHQNTLNLWINKISFSACLVGLSSLVFASYTLFIFLSFPSGLHACLRYCLGCVCVWGGGTFFTL